MESSTRDGNCPDPRRTWSNCIGNVSVKPRVFANPKTKEELIAIVKRAAAEKSTVRAVGSGHSFSDVAITPDYLINTHCLNAVLAVRDGIHCIREEIDTSCVVQVECGIRIRDINRRLRDMGLGLNNMGGYDAQTIMGVISTATHGSGLTLGAIADSVLSVDIIDGSGMLCRVEPKGGVTSASAFHIENADARLIQDDDMFHSVVVGMGSIGVVYSLILQVRPFYYIEERRSVCDWDVAQQVLRPLLDANRHVDIYLNPYKLHGRVNCLLTRRNERVPGPGDKTESKRHRSVKYEGISRFVVLLRLLPMFVALVRWLEVHIRFLQRLHWMEHTINLGLSELEDECYIDMWYKVLNIGRVNDVPSNSMEIAFDVDDCLKAINRILDLAVSLRREGIYFTSPLGVRFVKRSEHFMAMNYDRDTCIVEVPMLVPPWEDPVDGYAVTLYRRLLAELTTPMYNGRPHWGHWNNLTTVEVARLYPKFQTWSACRARFNVGGVFDSDYTRKRFSE